MAGTSGLRKSSWRQTGAIVPVLAALAALPYLIAGAGEFVALDDDLYVLDNRAIRDGLTARGIRWALTAFHATNWHPLTWMSHMLDVSLFGLDPLGHHLTSVVLHSLSTGLLFIAIMRLTGALWSGALAAALFAVHPLRVESVAWVAERKDVLSGTFFMLLLLAYERYARRGGAGRYFTVAVLLALGLSAKPMLVTVPLVLLLLDWWPLGRLWPVRGTAPGTGGGRAVLLEKIPLLALSAASGLLTFLAQRSGGAVLRLEVITPARRAANAVVASAAYLGKEVWPVDLAVYYPYPGLDIPWPKLALAAPLLVAISVAVVARRRKWPWLAFGWCWYLVMLLPVVGIVQVGEQALADRYTYLPMIGPVLAAVLFLAGQTQGRGRRSSAAAAAMGAVVVACLTAIAVRQAGFWCNSETLFWRTLAVTGPNPMIGNNLATVLMGKERYAEALVQLEDVIRTSPGYRPQAHNNIGSILFRLGHTQEAVDHFLQAVRLRTRYPDAHYNLALALENLGRRAEAEQAYREAIRQRPDFPAAHAFLGHLLASLGRNVEAEGSYREAIRLDPRLASAHTNLGALLIREGRFQEAETTLREAVSLHPDMVEALVNLGYALLSQGRLADAEIAYREALRHAPDSAPARAGLGRALAAMGRTQETAH